MIMTTKLSDKVDAKAIKLMQNMNCGMKLVKEYVKELVLISL